MKAFASQTLSQRARLYKEAAKFAKTAATGLTITTTAAALGRNGAAQPAPYNR